MVLHQTIRIPRLSALIASLLIVAFATAESAVSIAAESTPNTSDELTPSDHATADTRIVGGVPIDIASAPYQVFIAEVDLESGQFQAFCGGSIYSDQWVITAAHCAQRAGSLAVDRLRVGFGTNDLSSIPLSRFRPVAGIVIHPEWNSTTFANDIALLKLSEPLPIEPGRVEPVSLPISLPPAWPVAGTTAQVAGWGLLRHGTDLTSNTLQSAAVRVLIDLGDPNCGRYADYGLLYQADSMLCAGVPEAAIGVCRGDSGGGLVVSVGAVRYLAGVTSWSIGCAGEFNDGNQIIFDDWPGVYSRATTFVDWIRAVTATTPPPPPPFDPERPSRIYDTRTFTARLAPGQITEIALPPELAGASAAVVNVTATNAFADGFFTVFACGGQQPATSNGNYVGVSTIANNVIAPIGVDNSICITTGQSPADIIVDLFGFYPDPSQYTALVPTRVADTRQTNNVPTLLPPDTTLAVRLPASVPDDADAVALNVTAANALGDGFVSVWSCDGTVPATSNANYVGISTVANSVITAIGENRSVCIRTGQAPANIIVDLMGYYPASSSTTAIEPRRLLDTRSGSGQIRPGETLTVPVGDTVPADATQVTLNVTAANATEDGYLSVYPCGRPVPATSNVNFVGISTIANSVISTIGENRSICISTGQGATDVIVDLFGYATN